MMTEAQRELFAHRHELDFAFTIPAVARFRCNVMRQRGSVGVVLRVVADAIPSFEALGLPTAVVSDLASRPRGLVLVTGPTGSGKSTTLAAMIDFINRRYPKNVVTVEDPIEFLHRNEHSLVIQREIGLDTADFVDALKYAMRQDPDVIMVGEMRDKATVEAALTAAQTGHLVLSTLHTLDAIRTVNRVIDFFPPHERQQIRILLSESLLGILSQRLLPARRRPGPDAGDRGPGQHPADPRLHPRREQDPLIKDALMEDSLRGMQTFDQHLVELYLAGTINLEDAVYTATSPHELQLMITQRAGGRDVVNEAEFERLALRRGPVRG
jgi:twitching motility protein PilT